jgi:hypothetical protein
MNTTTTMNTTKEPFTPFPKMARLQREVIITEKIDGTNAQIFITDDGRMLTGSRNRWITPEDDHYDFAKWARDNKDELMQLGPGSHFGEWWGQGIQRNYGLDERRFSLFNVSRWCLHGETPQPIPTADPRIVKMQEVLPACCHLVPILRRGINISTLAESALYELTQRGSVAAPGFMHPEGIVVFHTAGNVGFKMTLDNDGVPKSSLKS